MAETSRPNLQPIESDYEIVAGLGDHGDGSAYLARRRNDGLDVLIRVERTPQGDERNALTLLAADVKALAALRHRHVVPIVEGRWLGTDAFAVVSERIAHPTLQEWIARGEEPTNERVALILQQVNDVLAWAREQKLVHRTVDTTSVYIDPDSDSVDVSFVVRPIPLTGVAGAEGDARSIAALAVAMLVRAAEPSPAPIELLTQRRPDIPRRVVDETAALLQPSRRSDAHPDVRGFISLVAMADALKHAEEHAHHTEEVLAGDRQTFVAKVERQRAALARERQAFADSMVRDRAALAERRATLERQIAEERERLATIRADLEESLAALATHRAQLEPKPVVDERPIPAIGRELRGVFAGAAALVIIVLAVAFGIAHRRSSAAALTASAPQGAIDSSAGAVLVPLPSSHSGASTASTAARPVPVTPPDSGAQPDSAVVAAAAAAADSARAARARRARHRRMLDSIRALQDSVLGVQSRGSTSARPDTFVRHDTVPKPKPDTSPNVRPDSGGA